MIAGIIVITGGAGIRITSVGCGAVIIAATILATTTAITMVGTGGVTGIIARTGMVIADVMTAGVVTADVMTAGAAAVIADMTATADVIAVTRPGEQGRLSQPAFFICD
jgi:hypothetical protein